MSTESSLMLRMRLPLAVLSALIGVGVYSLTTRVNVQQSLEQRARADLRDILVGLQNVPPPPPPVVGTLSPYQVRSNFSTVEIGGPERASCRFVESSTGLIIHVDIHTCRPRVMHSRDRSGELNLVDGSNRDYCTSGGMVTVHDPRTDEEFPIRLKLIGAPNASIGWNARQLVSPRNESTDWRETLTAIEEQLELSDLFEVTLPPSTQESGTVIRTHDASQPSVVLMYGDRKEMLTLFGFRETLAQFYSEPDERMGRRLVRMTIGAILESDTQRRLSEQWINRLRRSD